MKFWRAASLALALSVVGTASQAQMSGAPGGPGSFYLRAEGGWNHADGFSFSGNPPAGPGSINFKEGYIAGGAIGYVVAPTPLGNFRVELNLDYRDNDVKSLSVTGLAPGSASGSVDSIAGMVNGLFDLPFNFVGLKPYIGAGVGAESMHLSGVGVSGVALVSDRDTVPAAQAIAGVKYDLTPNWGVGLEYRFLNGFNPRFHTVNNSSVSTSNAQDHSILLTLTYAFGAPPPPPPPVQPAAAPAPPPPAPAPAATVPPGQFFIVFFDFDKSTITAAGQQVLDAAAAAFSQNHPVRIELTGFTDTVGTQRYNLGLSQRRAVAVHNYLAAHGVPDSAMDVAWKGKEDLRVPTPDGVREPQNRRVEIVIPQ
jgi:OOP family OmpA-OmpF porin